MSQPFTTRADTAPDPLTAVVELMARTAYETGRPKGSGRPEWSCCTEQWREAMRREQRAAITAAVREGLITVNDLRSSS